jgi:hypothetical protein
VLVLVGARFLIVTDSKRVHGVLKNCENAVRNGDAGALMSQVAPDYQYQDLDRATLERMTRAIFTASRFSTVVIHNYHSQLHGDSANVTYAALIQTGNDSALKGAFRTSWRLAMQKRGKQWLITEIELVSVEGNSIGTLKQAMEQAGAASHQ